MKSLLTFAFLVAVVACQEPSPKPVPTPTGTGCEAACQKMIALHCVEATTPDGHPCSEVCEHIQATGVVSWHTDCIVSQDVTSCDNIKHCRELP